MITKESKVGIWGLGAVGLSAVMGAKERGAKTIIGIDINEANFPKGWKSVDQVPQLVVELYLDKKLKLDDLIPHRVHLERINDAFTFMQGGLSDQLCEARRLAQISIAAPLDKVWLLGCAVSRGYGAALNAAMITKESMVGIWGLGAVGLSAVMGAKERGAKTIIGIDINEAKFQKGWKSVDQVPQLVELYLNKKLKLDELIMHRVHLERINDAFTFMQGGLSRVLD
ncbi:hypothetical protein V5799_005367 [Amblyomma americanum]|uniref:Uncharacterized protein n=1 Tax=Amblyomma americanum TaxID=6943 RepID=A0AAQ4DZG2_AMBAM